MTRSSFPKAKVVNSTTALVERYVKRRLVTVSAPRDTNATVAYRNVALSAISPTVPFNMRPRSVAIASSGTNAPIAIPTPSDSYQSGAAENIRPVALMDPHTTARDQKPSAPSGRGVAGSVPVSDVVRK
jgi:hypothetical protein